MKKNIACLSFIVVALVLLMGCSKHTPEATAEIWLNAFYNRNYKLAKELSTAETKVELDKAIESTPKADGTVYQLTKINVASAKIHGDNATITYAIVDQPNVECPPLKMIRQHNIWLVQM